MKLSKEELIAKINGYEIDDNIKIELLEDVTDSMDVAVDNTEEIEELKSKYEELKEKYKERFLNGKETEEKEEEEDEEEEEKEEVIDVKEI